MSFEKILAKLKEYARSLKLDGDASKGRQSVNMNWFQEENEGEEKKAEEEEADGDLNKVSQLECSFCKKMGHTAAQCWKAKAKGKGKGDTPKGKSKGKNGGGGEGTNKGGPKGGCYTCGGDHFEAHCPKLGKGDSAKVFTLCPISEIPSTTDTMTSGRKTKLTTECRKKVLVVRAHLDPKP